MSARTNPASQSIHQGSAQYRARYAEPESGLAARCPDEYDMALAVPVCGESPSFIDGYLAAARRTGRLLVIAVLNGRVGADPSVHDANAACARALTARFSLGEVGPGAGLGHDESVSLLLVDRFTPDRRFPARQGVGLARKIGVDIALELIATGRVRHPFVAMTDADTRLPADYFVRVSQLEPDCAAAMVPFWHEPDGQRDVDRATALYEVGLRYLQRGLRWANSPYAFHSVGSTIVVHALAYAKARGVPTRQAAEDFYLLNKLGKIRPLARVGGAPVRIRSRVSGRVPFGTGAETARLVRQESLELYHPTCFAAIREVTASLDHLAESPSVTVPELLARMSPPIKGFLESQGALADWPRLCQQFASSRARLRHLHEWFDGFRTLKLLHHVRDEVAPSLAWQDAVGQSPFMEDVPVEDDGACLVEARTELLRLEQDLPRLVGPSVYQDERRPAARPRDGESAAR